LEVDGIGLTPPLPHLLPAILQLVAAEVPADITHYLGEDCLPCELRGTRGRAAADSRKPTVLMSCFGQSGVGKPELFKKYYFLFSIEITSNHSRYQLRAFDS